ncbi:methylated-DNA--[protein]-cysteine S-methyltransferase [Iningainema tapete]|uniref:Methylated-DNA--protein-cysteine methyltransferase n=1 Tax=Iningainema tapete BLCC-T55 TaxID=2748662 RepID=A0A8J6XEV5_9CYAN|nr:methylated-DNA--[protein]-cysteine S-methyltransferase [Iningainema tapete]MBD2771342.1 methylated-DNA--[protein]-cysteine S-methyltransferase [Iningainema tapete BLCC-T55]
MREFLWDKIDFQMGQILIVSDGEKLCALDFAGYESRMIKLLEKRYGKVKLIEKANPQEFSSLIHAYLSGDLSSVDEIPVSTGGTPFQQLVWQTLRSIPFGTVITYGELAQKIGRPTSYRAVGMTNSLNPVAIVLPCHRVIGKNSLTGYAGGLEYKRWLLRHEGVNLPSVI